MAEYETLIYERKGRIAYITMNRPEVLNAMNPTMSDELAAIWAEFDADEEAWVAILSGNGRAFSSGADLGSRFSRTPVKEGEVEEPPPPRRRMAIPDIPPSQNYKPTIAAIHGYAYGGGYLQAMACDLIVAAEGTKLQITEVKRGQASAAFWARAWFYTASRWATEISLTGRAFTAEDAHKHGMINYVVPQEELMAKAEELANGILNCPPLSNRATVKVVRLYASDVIRDAALYQSGLQLQNTEDSKEAARAAAERREPEFHAR